MLLIVRTEIQYTPRGETSSGATYAGNPDGLHVRRPNVVAQIGLCIIRDRCSTAVLDRAAAGSGPARLKEASCMRRHFPIRPRVPQSRHSLEP